MLRVIRSLLLKIVDDIDAGNSNISEGEAIEIVDSLKRFTDKEKRLSKYAACEYLNVSRATFDNYVREDHFNESEAEYLVSRMYHTENGRKYSGEKFDMHKAKEVCERYRGILPTSVTAADVYVAINSQYHDYAELFRSWFTDGIEQRVIESAIVFWFKDADCKSENKIVEYFREH